MIAIKKAAIAALLLSVGVSATAQEAKSQKHAKKATEWRQGIYQLLKSNMGPLGAMAKGKIPLNKAVIEKNAVRINQLSLMIDDYMAVDTRKFKVKTEALNKAWTDRDLLKEKSQALTLASANLSKVVISGDDAAIKKAIGQVGKSCGGCHDSFKEE